MLGSWFASKPNDKKTADPTRRSTDVPNGTNSFQPSTADHPDAPDDDNSKPPQRAFSTPHDAVLAELYGYHPDANTTVGPEDRFNPELPSRATTAEDSNIHFTLSEYPSPGPASAPAPTSAYSTRSDSVPNPVVSPPPNIHAEAHVQLGEAASKNEEVWLHLSRVLDLQRDIARLHVDMEGIGAKADGKGKGPRKGPKASWEEGKAGVGMEGGAGAAGGVDRDGEGEGEDEGVGVEEDEEAERNKAREEEFANLADNFQGRKVAIDQIMDKLGDLSKALTEFHALRTPMIDFSNNGTSQRSSLNLATEPISPPQMQRTSSAMTPRSPTSLGPPTLIPVALSRSAPTPTTTKSMIDPGSPPGIVESPASIRSNLPSED